MDLRKERTRLSIINAFLELRAKKSLERITVKELSELAMINKATFYTHYEDIYDLASQLENDTIDSILSSVSNLDKMVEDPKRITHELSMGFLSQIQLISILFSDSRNSILADRLEERFKKMIFEVHPEYDTLEWNVKLTAILQGSFHAFASNYKDNDIAVLTEIIGDMNEKILKD